MSNYKGFPVCQASACDEGELGGESSQVDANIRVAALNAIAPDDCEGCGLRELQAVIEQSGLMLLVPDGRRTRGTPSLAMHVVYAVAGDANRGVQT